MAELHWPICDACEGYGTKLLNSITHQRSVEPCSKCGGAGRMKPVEPESDAGRAPEAP